MKNVEVVAAFIAALSQQQPVSAQAANTYLCITDQSTGFSNEGGTWRIANFKTGERYIIKRSVRTGVAWEVQKFGEPSALPVASCKSDFVIKKLLHCEGMLTEFKFNAATGRFLKSYIGGYWTYVPGQAFMGRDTGDTPALDIGTCSAI